MEARPDGAKLLRISRCVMAVCALALSCEPAAALINQNYTPVDIVHQSETILRLRVGPWDRAKNRLTVKLVGRALTGSMPKGFSLAVDSPDEAVANAIEKILKARTPAAAMVFIGDFSEAKDAEADDDGKPVGAAYVGMEWFALAKVSPGVFRLGKDIYDLKTVWAGGNDMLAEVVRYVQADSRADVPTNTSTAWASEARLAAVDGHVSALIPVDLGGASPAAVLMLARSGDRLVRRAGGLELQTNSRLAAWGDFNADGLTDVACWGAAGLTLNIAGKDGTFRVRPTGAAFRECISLVALPAGKGGRAGLLVGTTDRPVLMAPDGKGGFAGRPLPAAEGKKLGTAGPCVVADFTGDGLPDIVQPLTKGLLLYCGKARGLYAPGIRAGTIAGGGEAGTITTALCGDYDADGRLDIMLGGANGCTLLAGLDGGTFREVIGETGELVRLSKPNVVDMSNCDINNDGRQDVVLFYSNRPMQVFFNRGFRCFGFANLLDLEHCRLPAAGAFKKGQSAGAVVDLNGDGAQDVVAVTAAGQLCALLRDSRRGGKLGVTVTLPPGLLGPVTVVGYDGKRCLGARTVSPGRPALFGKRTKGPITLKWTPPGGKTQSKRMIVLRPRRFVLPAPLH